MMFEEFDFVVVGGGIAGTSCVQRLCSLIDDHYNDSSKNEKTFKLNVLLLSSSQMVKTISNVKSVTKFLREFDVEEKSAADLFLNRKDDNRLSKYLKIYEKTVVDLDSANKLICCHDGSKYKYKKLCICSGGKPKLITSNDTNSKHVIGIRDTETVQQFLSRLSQAKQVVIVGNGGIATELVYEIENCRIVWAIKDTHISHIYFDAHVAKFFETLISENKLDDGIEESGDKSLPVKRTKYTISKIDASESESSSRTNELGPGLGPDWSLNLASKGAYEKKRDISIEYQCEVERVLSKEEYEKQVDTKSESWPPVYVKLTNGKIFGCDFAISATGVKPSTEVFTKNNNFELADDGGFKVNDKLRTNIDEIYAAGDSCTACWPTAPHWFQMRLWSQASQMGDYAARSMWSSRQDSEIQLDFCFELFAHITKFFNFKVILLGNYDARGLGNDYQLLLRCTPGVEYVKVVLQNGRVQGCLLIGETDLEETFENLILNQIDVSELGEDLINPDIDIEDYFD